MNSLMTFLLIASAKAAVLVLLVLLANLLLSRWVAARWRYLLWGLVALRLVLPPCLPSETSLFNLLVWEKPVPATVQEIPLADTAPVFQPLAPEFNPAPVARPTANPVIVAAPAKPVKPAGHLHISAWTVASLAWLGGMLALLAVMGSRYWKITARIRRQTPVSDPAVLELLSVCQAEMRITTRISMIETTAVQSPALLGIFQPRLLLPQGMTASLSRAELRHVILHELAHLRSQDVAINWLAALIQAAHWFNPLVWLAFRRMRQDQELACDEAVLATLRPEERGSYGRTLVNLTDYCPQRATAGLVGIIEKPGHLARRIQRIGQYRQPSRTGHWLAALVLLGLGAISLTEAVAQEAKKPKAAATATKLAADTDRFYQKLTLPGNRGIVVASEGDFEPRSQGSYSIQLYGGANPEFPLDDFLAGEMRPRDNGAIEQVLLKDIDGDRQDDVIVTIRCVGNGSYLSADAFSVADKRLTLLAAVADLDKAADVVKALQEKRNRQSIPEAIRGTWVITSHCAPGISALSTPEANAWIGKTLVIGNTCVALDGEKATPQAIRSKDQNAKAYFENFKITPAAVGCNGKTVREYTIFDGQGGTLIMLGPDQALTTWDGVFFRLTRKKAFVEPSIAPGFLGKWNALSKNHEAISGDLIVESGQLTFSLKGPAMFEIIRFDGQEYILKLSKVVDSGLFMRLGPIQKNKTDEDMEVAYYESQEKAMAPRKDRTDNATSWGIYTRKIPALMNTTRIEIPDESHVSIYLEQDGGMTIADYPRGRNDARRVIKTKKGDGDLKAIGANGLQLAMPVAKEKPVLPMGRIIWEGKGSELECLILGQAQLQGELIDRQGHDVLVPSGRYHLKGFSYRLGNCRVQAEAKTSRVLTVDLANSAKLGPVTKAVAKVDGGFLKVTTPDGYELYWSHKIVDSPAFRILEGAGKEIGNGKFRVIQGYDHKFFQCDWTPPPGMHGDFFIEPVFDTKPPFELTIEKTRFAIPPASMRPPPKELKEELDFAGQKETVTISDSNGNGKFGDPFVLSRDQDGFLNPGADLLPKNQGDIAMVGTQGIALGMPFMRHGALWTLSVTDDNRIQLQRLNTQLAKFAWQGKENSMPSFLLAGKTMLAGGSMFEKEGDLWLVPAGEYRLRQFSYQFEDLSFVFASAEPGRIVKLEAGQTQTFSPVIEATAKVTITGTDMKVRNVNFTVKTLTPDGYAIAIKTGIMKWAQTEGTAFRILDSAGKEIHKGHANNRNEASWMVPPGLHGDFTIEPVFNIKLPFKLTIETAKITMPPTNTPVPASGTPLAVPPKAVLPMGTAPDFSHYPQTEAFNDFTGRTPTDNTLLDITVFYDNDGTALRYMVPEKGETINVREVYNWALQDMHGKPLSATELKSLHEAIRQFPAENTYPPLNRLVIVRFRQGTTWTSRSFDSLALPEPMRRIYDIIGEREESKRARTAQATGSDKVPLKTISIAEPPNIEIDREKCARLGVSVATVADACQNLEKKGQTIDAITVKSIDGKTVRLRDLIKVAIPTP